MAISFQVYLPRLQIEDLQHLSPFPLPPAVLVVRGRHHNHDLRGGGGGGGLNVLAKDPGAFQTQEEDGEQKEVLCRPKHFEADCLREKSLFNYLSFYFPIASERETRIIITTLLGIFFRNTYTHAADYKDVEKLPKCLGDKFSSSYLFFLLFSSLLPFH